MGTSADRTRRRGDRIKFLGTAGARFVVSKQLRSSGGIWLSLAGAEILIDPGPGSLLLCSRSRPRLEPSRLDAIILTHKHIDHSGDINAMIEAMTEGGSRKRGQVLAPADALAKEPVIFPYLRDFPGKIEYLTEGGSYRIGSVSLFTPRRHIHPVETYGLHFEANGKTLSLISDTRYFEGIEQCYPGRILVIYTVLLQPYPDRVIEHLSLEDARRIIKANRPGLTLLTHFGMMVLNARPRALAENMGRDLGLRVEAARDGMEVAI